MDENESVNTLNIIHLMEREDRYELLIPQLQSQNIADYKIWEGQVNRTDRKEGICRSHKAIVQDAKDRGLERVHIAEDDITFNCDGCWDYYLSKIPDSYDLFFSMVYLGEIRNGRLISVCSGFTMYTVHSRFYDFFLSIPDSVHIDRHLSLYSNQFEFIVIDKFVCFQNGTRSSNNFMQCDYSSYLKGRKIYGQD